jgi:hypothetical protein
MPFIAFDLAAMEDVAPAAQIAGIPTEKMGWGLPKLWAWCWKTKRDTVAGPHLEGFFGGPADRVGAALVAFGFADQVPESGEWRVRGAEKYLRISRARSTAGKQRAAAPRRPNGTLKASKPPANAGEPTSTKPALPPNTEHRTLSIEQPPAPQRAEVLALEAQAAEEKKPRKRSEGQRFFDRCAELWHDVHPTAPREAEPDPRKLNSWFAEAVRDVGPERLGAAYCAYVRGKFKAEERHPFGVFMSAGVWRSRVPDEAPPPPEQCGCPGCSNPRGDRAGGRPVCNGHFAEWMAAYERDWPGGSTDFGAEHFSTWLSRVAA